MTLTVHLPFPDKILWPNGRGHRMAKARAIKTARKLAAWEVIAAYRPRPDWEAVRLDWVIHPKTAHPIDDDAPPSALKAYRDGIADALGIDDAHFQATYQFGAPIKGGAVLVTISEAKP